MLPPPTGCDLQRSIICTVRAGGTGSFLRCATGFEKIDAARMPSPTIVAIVGRGTAGMSAAAQARVLGARSRSRWSNPRRSAPLARRRSGGSAPSRRCCGASSDLQVRMPNRRNGDPASPADRRSDGPPAVRSSRREKPAISQERSMGISLESARCLPGSWQKGRVRKRDPLPFYLIPVEASAKGQNLKPALTP